MILSTRHFDPFPTDAYFESVVNTFTHRWTGSNVGTLDQDATTMRDEVIHALACLDTTSSPFLALLILLAWKDVSWRRSTHLSHPHIEIMFQFSKGTMSMPLPQQAPR